MLVRVLFLSLTVLALAGAGYLLLNPPDTTTPAAEAAPAPPPVKLGTAVLVAARPMPAGTLLRPEDLRWQEWTPGGTPEGYILRGQMKDDAVYGAVTRRAFVIGEPLVQGQIVLPGERGFLAAVLTPGRRAVAVAVDAVSAASGLIWPGDRVDLVLAQTFERDETPPARRAVGETLLKDLRVLSIDQKLADTGTTAVNGDRTVPRTVTLEVTAKEAEMVAVAAGLGRLSLVLRSLGSEDVADVGDAAPVTATWAGDVSPALNARRPAAAPAPKVAHDGGGMLVVRGSQRTVHSGS